MRQKSGFAISLIMRQVVIGLILVPVMVSGAFAQRTRLKPGWNLFSPQQDVELGQQVSKDAESKLPMLNKRQVDEYLNRLGTRLAGHAPGEKYPYQFRCVNDASINAFALPGGFLYVHRGTIEAADNEAELAGVIGHEIGHVALRHGTNQASKQQLAQFPLAILGGAFGSNSIASLLTQLGSSFAVNSILLKYSRDDERQSDLIGTQILYDAGYQPQYMAQFFEKLETGKRGSDFFSSHPNPDNRIRNINVEISRLGAISAGARSDSSEFQRIKRYLKSLPPAPKTTGGAAAAPDASGEIARPARPSSRYRSYNSGYVSLRHPDNWKVYGNDQDFAVAPERGIVAANGDSEALAYGVTMAVSTSGSTGSLRTATEQLVRNLQNANPAMRLSRDRGQIRVGGQVALSRLFVNDSPLGEREIDWLVTVMRPEGLVYFVFVSPEQEFANYQAAFQQILDSVRFQ